MKMRKRVYICSPCRGNYERNIDLAKSYSRDALEMGYLPITPHIYLTQLLNDNIPAERELGLRLGRELLALCDEIWVYGAANPSEGMRAEIELAGKLGIPVREMAREA